MPTIQLKVARQGSKPGTERGGRTLCIRTSYGFNCQKKKKKLSDSESRKEPGSKCLLYEARNNFAVQEAKETRFKDTLREINPNGISKRLKQS